MTYRSLVGAAVTLAGLVAVAARPLAQTQLDLANLARTAQAAALDIACAPRAAYQPPPLGLLVLGGYEDARQLYGPWLRVVISAGSNQGLKPGQEYFARRLVPPIDRGQKLDGQPISIHTVGWVRIEKVEPEVAIATIVHECDGMLPGDYLEPFALPPVPALLPEGEPDYSTPARVLFGDERRMMGGAGNFLVIDRGSDDNVRPGQRISVFRRSLGGIGPIITIARGHTVAVAPESSTVKLDWTGDAVYGDDLVAMHR